MTKVPKGEILYCERCGISFLWSVGEQKEAGDARAERPRHCPGCRHSMPPPGRERGLVKWWNARKKYGFIVRAGHPDIFAHRSQLQGVGRLREGDLVEFGVEERKKGPVAVAIRVLESQPTSSTSAS